MFARVLLLCLLLVCVVDAAYKYGHNRRKQEPNQGHNIYYGPSMPVYKPNPNYRPGSSQSGRRRSGFYDSVSIRTPKVIEENSNRRVFEKKSADKGTSKVENKSDAPKPSYEFKELEDHASLINSILGGKINVLKVSPANHREQIVRPSLQASLKAYKPNVFQDVAKHLTSLGFTKQNNIVTPNHYREHPTKVDFVDPASGSIVSISMPESLSDTRIRSSSRIPEVISRSFSTQGEVSSFNGGYNKNYARNYASGIPSSEARKEIERAFANALSSNSKLPITLNDRISISPQGYIPVPVNGYNTVIRTHSGLNDDLVSNQKSIVSTNNLGTNSGKMIIGIIKTAMGTQSKAIDSPVMHQDIMNQQEISSQVNTNQQSIVSISNPSSELGSTTLEVTGEVTSAQDPTSLSTTNSKVENLSSSTTVTQDAEISIDTSSVDSLTTSSGTNLSTTAMTAEQLSPNSASASTTATSAAATGTNVIQEEPTVVSTSAGVDVAVNGPAQRSSSTPLDTSSNPSVGTSSNSIVSQVKLDTMNTKTDAVTTNEAIGPSQGTATGGVTVQSLNSVSGASNPTNTLPANQGVTNQLPLGIAGIPAGHEPFFIIPARNTILNPLFQTNPFLLPTNIIPQQLQGLRLFLNNQHEKNNKNKV